MYFIHIVYVYIAEKCACLDALLDTTDSSTDVLCMDIREPQDLQHLLSESKPSQSPATSITLLPR